MASARSDILRLEKAQAESFNSRRIADILKQFGPGFVGFSSTRHSRIGGKAALRKTFHHYLKQSPRARYRITQPKVQVFDGTAVASFYWSVELGRRRRVRGRGSHVLVRRNRRWQIVHEHFSRAH